MIGLLLVAVSFAAPRPPVVVFGPGSNELRMLAAKLAARAGHDAALVAPDAKTATLLKRLMYGGGKEADVEDGGRARVLVGAEQLGSALSEVKNLVLVCDSAPLPKGSCQALLTNTPLLERCVLVSKMGVTRARPAGPFGIGGEDAALLANEEAIRSDLTSRGIAHLSIVRVGTLKGGGPGGAQGAYKEGDDEQGLAKTYIDTIIDLEAYMTTQSHDQFTLGANCRAGDPIDLPNPLVRAATRGGFEPRDDETNRAVAAAAVTHALSHPTAVELSVGSARSDSLPTEEEWSTIFGAL